MTTETHRDDQRREAPASVRTRPEAAPFPRADPPAPAKVSPPIAKGRSFTLVLASAMAFAGAGVAVGMLRPQYGVVLFATGACLAVVAGIIVAMRSLGERRHPDEKLGPAP